MPEKPSAAADIDSVDWVKSRKETVKTVEDDLSWVKHPKAPDDALAIKDQLLNNVSDIANSALNRNSEAARALGVELDNTSSSPGGNPANSLGHTPIPQRPIIVFISMNLSDDYLREMFAYGATHPDVRFVLQGWIPPKIGDLQNALGALITDLSHPPNIDIDPSIFKQYDVQSVPVFVREDTNPVRRIDGELSLDGAVDWLLSHRPAPANPVGPLSDIEEPNILDEIQQRLENFDWKAQIAKAKENAGHMLQGVFLPPAEKDNTYWVDISTIFKQDITLPDGRVVVKAGTRVNPLDSVRLDHRYVFFDPKDRHQVNIVKKWLRRYNNLTLIATQFKPLADESSALVKELGQLV
ncbi:TrbC family F-type conjugative pilus assembly protein, partial [Thiolapillus sp.]